MIEWLTGIVGLVRENMRLIIELVAVASAVGALLRKRQWKKAAVAFFKIGHIAYSAIEDTGKQIDSGEWENKHKEIYRDPVDYVKKAVHAAVKNTALEDANVLHAENVVRLHVQPKENVPAIKRFWRRAIKGKNFAGVAAQMFAKAALEKEYKRRFE